MHICRTNVVKMWAIEALQIWTLGAVQMWAIEALQIWTLGAVQMWAIEALQIWTLAVVKMWLFMTLIMHNHVMHILCVPCCTQYCLI
jgi:hypothetical protein